MICLPYKNRQQKSEFFLNNARGDRSFFIYRGRKTLYNNIILHQTTLNNKRTILNDKRTTLNNKGTTLNNKGTTLNNE